MSANTYLALLLDAPMQSWGFASRFQRRTTGLYPTKSGVIGLICAAMGLEKGSTKEGQALRGLRELHMTSIAIPRQAGGPKTARPLPIHRLEDYHTVLGTRLASGKMNADAVVTRRQYLLDARFGVILRGNDRVFLNGAAAALQDPVWGVWLGRKNCIPAAPVLVVATDGSTAFGDRRHAFEALLRAEARLRGEEPEEPLPDEAAFDRVDEVRDFTGGTDSWFDEPVSFGDGTSSGPDKRQFAVRRIKVQPGTGLPAKE